MSSPDRRILLTCDDVFRRTDFELCQKHGKNGLPVTPAIFVRPQDQREKVGKISSPLPYGLHLNFFGVGPYCDQHLFGQGVLRSVLALAESQHSLTRRLGELLAPVALAPYASVILREMLNQLNDSGSATAWLSYHYGLHNSRYLYDIFAAFAHIVGVPHRHAPQYNLNHPGRATHFLDALNHPKLTPKQAIQALEALPPGSTTEICLHLTDPVYGAQQNAVLQNPGILAKLTTQFALVWPDELKP